MTDFETLQAFKDQQAQADQAAQAKAAELPDVPVPEPTATGADMAILKDYLKIQPMFQPDKTVTQQLPPFQPETTMDITTGVKPGRLADPFDASTLDDFITDRAAAMGQDQMNRAVQLMDAYHRGEWSPPPSWLHDIALRINAQTPSFPQLAEEYGKAALRLAGLPTEMPKSGQWASTLLHQPGNTLAALANDQMAVLGMIGGAAKTVGQAAMEQLTTPSLQPEEFLAPRKAAAVGLTKGVAGFYPLYEEAVTKLGVPLYNQLAPGLGMTPADRVDYIERTANAYNRVSRLVHGEESLLGYNPEAAPATEAVGEFAGGVAPFMLLPEAAGVNNLAARVATRAISPVVERAVPLVAAADVAGQQAALRAAPVARQLAAKGVEAGLGYAAGEITGLPHGGPIGALAAILLKGGRGTLRDIITAFKAAPDPAIVDQMGPALMKSLKQGRPYYSALQDGVQDEIDRLTMQNRMIRTGADDLKKTDAKMPNGENVFNKDELKNNAITVRDNIAIQTDKLNRLKRWAEFERLVTDTVTGTLATGAATVPTGLVLGGINALQAPPGTEQEAALQGMQTGMALDLPFAPGKVSRAMRQNAVRGLTSRGRAMAITPDHPDYAENMASRAEMAKTEQGRIKLDAMDQFAGLLSPLGTKVVAHSEAGMASRHGGAPEAEAAPAPEEAVPTTAMPPTRAAAPNAVYDGPTNTIHYNYEAPLDTLGHELSHPFERAVGENLVGQRLRAALSNPADQPFIKAFLDQYRELMRRSNPNFENLSPQEQISEMFAELGRDVIRETPPSALYGGRSGWQLMQRTAGRIADMIRGRKEVTTEIPPSPGQIGLRAPQFPGTRAAMEDLLFGLGERAKYRQPYGPGAEMPPTAAGPAVGAVPRPPTDLSPEEQDVLKRVHAASQKLGGVGVSPSDVGDAIVVAKQAGVDVSDSNILRIVLNQASGRDPLHGVTGPVVTPQPQPQPPGPAVQHPDYEDIRIRAQAAMREKLAGSKAKDVETRIERAGIEAAAQAHAKAVGPESDLITWRTDKYGKTSITGKRADYENDPFHRMLIDRAKQGALTPEGLQNLNDLEANMGRAIAVDYSHAPEEQAMPATRPGREEERAAATAPERVAGEVARVKLTKSFVPTAITYQPRANVFVVNGFSPDKFLNNANLVIDWARRKGIKTYDGVNDPLLVQYMQQLTTLHDNGYTGEGKPITGTGLTPVKQTPGFEAEAKKLAIPRDYLDQLNVMMGNTTARTGVKGLSPEQAEKQALAKENSPYFDPATGETNRFRKAMGTEAAKLEPVYETLRPELIRRVRQAPVTDEETLRPSGFTGDRAQLGLRGLPRQEFVAAGFMPATGTPGLKPLYQSEDASANVSPRGYISNLFVRPDARGRGEGSALMGQIAADADRAGIPLTLHIGEQRGDLPGFYERFGFREAGRDQFGILYRREPAPVTPARTGAPGIWDTAQTAGQADELAARLGVDPKKRFWEQKPVNRQKITDYYRWSGEAQYMPATTGYDPEFKQPQPASDEEIASALQSKKAPLVGQHRNLPEGTPVSVRIDIPSFLRSGVYAQTVHDPKMGKVKGYDSIVRLDGPVGFTVREGISERIKNRQMNKAPIAAVEGKYNPDRALPEDINDLSQWTPLGFDPYEHSYFYDKTSDDPVMAADSAINIGNTVYVKNPVYAPRSNFRYMPATGFYTKAGRAIEEKMGGAADSEQIKALLRNAGIGKNEMEWLGLNDLPPGRMTKEQMQQWIVAHTPAITVTTRGGRRRANEPYLEPKYQTYKLPGGEDYSEILINLPYVEPPRAPETEQVPYTRPPNTYRAPHFYGSDATNLVGHLRTTDRTTADGNSMKFIEEAQSDWAQAIRKEGPARQREIEWVEITPTQWHSRGAFPGSLVITALSDGQFELRGQTAQGIAVSDLYPTFEAARADANEYSTSGIRDMPFKGEAWKKLLLRQAIQTAVEEGKSSIGWTTGAQQAARYNLAMEVKSINWGAPPSGYPGVRRIVVDPVRYGEKIIFYVNDKGKVEQSTQGRLQDHSLSDIVGGGLAKRMLSEPEGKAEGEGLTIGGEGMKGFYDKELVNIANDIGKKFGTKVRDSEIYTHEGEWAVIGRRAQRLLPFHGVEEGVAGGSTIEYILPSRALAEQSAQQNARQHPDYQWEFVQQTQGIPETVHELPITPEMRQSVAEQGQPMFMPATGFYPRSQRLIDDKMPNVADSEQIKALLRNAGIGKNEMEWLGLNDLPPGKMTKQQMQLWIAGHTPQVSTITLGGKGQVSAELQNYISEDYNGQIPGTPEEWIGLQNRLEDRAIYHSDYGRPNLRQYYLRLATEAYDHASGEAPTLLPARYEQYSLPGGDNYREILMNLPAGSEVLYRAPHFQGTAADNLIGHLRVKDRTTTAGNNMTFIEEAQSDWGQEGRKSGFRTPEVMEQMADARKKRSALIKERNEIVEESAKNLVWKKVSGAMVGSTGLDEAWNIVDAKTGKAVTNDDMARAYPAWSVVMAPDETSAEVAQKPAIFYSSESAREWRITLQRNGVDSMIPYEKASRLADIYPELGNLEEILNKNPVSDMPFKGEGWKKLLLRQAIKTAVEDGKDSVGWTTGQQQADRYDLSRQVDRVYAYKTKKGNFNIEVAPVRGPHGEPMGVQPLADEVIPNKLDQYVGRELADKIRAQKEDVGAYEGGDLKIGGEGMKGFYDRELVNIANDIGKKFGTKVQDAQIDTGTPEWRIEGRRAGSNDDWSMGGTTSDRDAAYDAMVDRAKSYPNFEWRVVQTKEALEKIHELPITQAMRNSVLSEGQFLFMPNTHPEAMRAPAIRRIEDNKIFPAIAATTGLHAQVVAEYPEELADYYSPEGYKRYEDGYVTNQGEFKNKSDAFPIAQRIGQIVRPLQYAGEVQSNELGLNQLPAAPWVKGPPPGPETQAMPATRPSGTWEEVARYLTPEQLATVGERFRDRIVEPFLQLDVNLEKSLQYAQLGAVGRKWYEGFVNAIHDMLGSDDPTYASDPQRFAALMAALSANRSVGEDVEHTLMAWALWEAQGRPQDHASLEDIIHATVPAEAGTEDVKSSLPAWIPNAIRAFTAEDPTNIRLSGPKVHAFYRNLIGDVHTVTVDRHMGIFGYGTPTVGSRTQVIGGQKFGIESFKNLAFQAHIRKVAEILTQMSGETWTPTEVQAAIWTHQLPVQDLADKLGITTEEFLAGGRSVPRELLEQTPSASLLQSEEHQRTIRRLQGLREENIRRTRAARSGVGGEGSEIAGQTEGGEQPFRLGGIVRPNRANLRGIPVSYSQ